MVKPTRVTVSGPQSSCTYEMNSQKSEDSCLQKRLLYCIAALISLVDHGAIVRPSIFK